jgi:hypothetical protein
MPEADLDSIKEILGKVQSDRDARKVFLAMPREEQLLAILGMIAYSNSQLAILQKQFIEHQSESARYREEREQREKRLVEILDTDPNIKAMAPDEKQSTLQKILTLATRPAKPGQLLDKVLSIILVIFTILFLTGRLSLP